MIELAVLDPGGDELGIIEAGSDDEEEVLTALADAGYLDGTVNDFTVEYLDGSIRVLDLDTEKCVLTLEYAEEDSDADSN